MKTSLIKCLSLLCTLVLLFLPMSHIVGQAQNPTVRCGDILESELLGDTQYQDITLQVQAGTTLDLSIIPLGSGFNPFVFLVDGGGGEIARANSFTAGMAEEFLNYPISSSNATLRVYGITGESTETFSDGDMQFTTGRNNFYAARAGLGKFYGAFQVSLGCTLRDGTVIEPGDAPLDAFPTEPSQPPTPAFSGVGFPGLAPVDFLNAAKLPLPPGVAMSGGITPTDDEILGYMLDASANDILDLTFTRLSGNLNLGLVVLSADNKVVFQASLVTSTTLNTRFTLPSAGQYTIGVFRIDLLPPAAPEATAFQVQGTLNP